MRILLLLLAGAAYAAPPSSQDLAQRLARWKQVPMRYDASGLDARQRQMVEKLVQASRELELIYWQQSDPEALALYRSTKDPQLKRLLAINGCRFDLIDDNKPFAGTKPIPAGRNIYPEGLTRQQIEAYAQAHPSERGAIYNPYTVLRWSGKKLDAIPYRVEYKAQLEPAVRLLREAAVLSVDKDFARFLTLRADALLSDDYYPSDLAWMDLRNPKIDVIFGPYETYLDDVLGVKTDYESAILIRNEPESQKLAVYQKYVPDIQDALPLAPADRPSKRGHLTPMEVMDAPFRTGDLLHGYQAVADNLPNDPRIHEAKGTKKIFFKNFMDARVNYVVLPLAKYLMPAQQAARASADGYLAAVVLHEISHGLGPAYSRVSGKQVPITEAIGPVYSALEEAKADVVGMLGLRWLMDHGALPANRAEEYYASYVAGIFRTVRYGIAEAHGRAEMMEFNFLFEQKAITRSGGKYAVDYTKMPAAIARVSKELLEIEATGDRARAEAWFNRYDKMPRELAEALQAAREVPVDIEPVFSFPVLE
ncbi:MAG TPA: Zn-dependent hydrolase [Bryobacteraceae bacterium]|nr:Zn-dependent hydrolase [Bryobacteraceae bacterium]